VPGATQVDFYVLDAGDQRARFTTACRVVEKAYEQGLKVTVRTASPAQTAELDDLLWTFSDRSFVPHGVWPAEPEFAAATPVMIASGALPAAHRDVLVNLGPDVPPELESFARVCEVVGGDEDSKQAARQRWRAYKQAGLAPADHKL
jgi:DNA polymerase-3 subunit chi